MPPIILSLKINIFEIKLAIPISKSENSYCLKAHQLLIVFVVYSIMPDRIKLSLTLSQFIASAIEAPVPQMHNT